MHVSRKRIAFWIVTVNIWVNVQDKSDEHHSWKASYAFTSIYATGSVFTPSVESLLDVRNELQFSDCHIIFQIIVFDWQVNGILVMIYVV